MNIQLFKQIIHERENTDDEWYTRVEELQEQLIDVLSEDIAGTNEYLRTECTADEFSWISEVFDEIAEKTQSKEFIAALRFLAQRYPEETKMYNIIPFIDSAELAIE